MRILFMGTPEFAVPALQTLVERGHSVAAVVTQPDRPVGRGGRVQAPPVKEAAERLGLNVLQPETLRSPDAIALLRSIAPDLIVVVAYGQILRRAVLDLPPLGCNNVHPSLLPKLRGASPIQSAIREGFSETGVSIMLMDPRMDAGPILSQIQAPIFADDTGATLGARLAQVGANLLADTIPPWQQRTIVPRPQDEAAATYCRPLRKEDADVDWQRSAEEIARTCRAQTPWPGCQSYWNGKLLRFLSVEARLSWAGPEPAGTVFTLPGGPPGRPILAVATGQGALEVRELQLAGRRPLTATEFLRGQPSLIGSVLAPATPGPADDEQRDTR